VVSQVPQGGVLDEAAHAAEPRGPASD
jgi:hypothetical protein